MKKFDPKLFKIPTLEEIETSRHNSFKTGVYSQPYFKRTWHYHPEYELLLIKKGFGTRLVGDHAESFSENDLVFLGGFMPHAWISDPGFLEPGSECSCESIYVQFRKSVFGTYFIDIPELEGVRKALALSARGVKIKGDNKALIIDLIKELPTISPLGQLLKLLQMLDLISKSEFELLATSKYMEENLLFKSQRMLKIHEYLMKNLRESITVADCAALINMTKPSFCRFFRKHANDNFSNYLNKLRIELAGKLLSNTQLSIKEISFEAGYNSITYFNKQFKDITGVSPHNFRVIMPLKNRGY